jgi:thiol-disulfide isomerase/thioredoxin
MHRRSLLLSLALLTTTLGAPLGAAADASSGTAVAAGYMGVQLTAVRDGLRVSAVVPNSPAAAAGMQTGDVIVRARGMPPGSVDAFISSVRAAGPGSRYPVQIQRGAQRLSLDVQLGVAPQGLAVGSPAPVLAAQLVMGPGPADLGQLRGRVVVLDFWASWCGPCRAVMPALNRLHQRYAAQGLAVVGVTDEGASVARRVGAQMALSYTLATDATAATRYGVNSLPTLVVVDRRGVVRHVTIGADSNEMRDLDRLVRQLLAEPAP